MKIVMDLTDEKLQGLLSKKATDMMLPKTAVVRLAVKKYCEAQNGY